MPSFFENYDTLRGTFIKGTVSLDFGPQYFHLSTLPRSLIIILNIFKFGFDFAEIFANMC
jgi:hypothetical protein